MQEECNDFVQTYTDEIVEACIAQLSPQEVCVYLKLCQDKNPPQTPVPKIEYGGIVGRLFLQIVICSGYNNILFPATNEIPDGTISGKVIPAKPTNSPLCVLCEFIMSQLEQELKDNATEVRIMLIIAL